MQLISFQKINFLPFSDKNPFYKETFLIFFFQVCFVLPNIDINQEQLQAVALHHRESNKEHEIPNHRIYNHRSVRAERESPAKKPELLFNSIILISAAARQKKTDFSAHSSQLVNHSVWKLAKKSHISLSPLAFECSR